MIDEKEIRTAFETKAHDIEVPSGLAAKTLDAVGPAKARLRDRFRIRPVRGFPRWMYATAAAAVVTLLFGLGTVVTKPHSPGVAVTHGPAQRGAGLIPPNTTSGEAKAGQVSGVVSSGSVSVDATNSASSSVGAQGPGTVAGPAQPPVPVPPSQPGVFPPKVVRNADIQVQVRRGAFDRMWSRALDIAARYGGFVTDSSTQQTDTRISSGTFTLRVPAAKLDAALKDLRNLGTLKSLSTSGNDISGQIADLDARIKADDAEQAQLLDLMKQADNVTDVLSIRSQLQSVQQDLGSLRAQKKSFQNQVDYATVNATIFEPNAGPQPVPLSDSVVVRAWRTAVSAGLTIVAGTLVVLGGLIPLALIALAVWGLVAAARRRRARSLP